MKKEPEIMNDSEIESCMVKLNQRISDAENDENAAKLGEAFAKVAAVKNDQKKIQAEKKVKKLELLGMIGVAALGLVGTVAAAIIRGNSQQKTVDRIAKYELEDDVIFTGKRSNGLFKD